MKNFIDTCDDLVINQETLPIISSITNNMPGGFLIYKANKSRELIFFNKNVPQYYGCGSAEEFLEFTNRSFLKMIHPDDFNRVDDLIKHQINSNKNLLGHIQHRILRSDGLIGYIDNYGRLIHSETYGDIFFVFIIDKTKEINELLKNTIEHKEELDSYSNRLSNYKNAILAESIISLEVNLTKKVLTYGEWKDKNGNLVNLEKIIGLSLPCDYDEYINKWKNTFVNKKSQNNFIRDTSAEFLINQYNNGISEITFDYEADTIDGEHEYLRRNIFMTKDNHGDILAYTTVKKSEIGKARANEKSYIEAFTRDYEIVDIISFDKNASVSISSAISPKFKKLLPSEFLKIDSFRQRNNILATMIVEEDRKNYLKGTSPSHLAKAFESDKVLSVNFRISEGRNETYYQSIFVPIKNYDNAINGMLACVRCTDNEIKKELGYRRDLENARKIAEDASKAKTTFLFNMSHDIRTPMNAIIGFAKLAKTHIDDKERVVDCINKLELSAEQLLNLINDVLEMSRIEAGKLEIVDSKVDISTVLSGINPMLEALAISKSINYKTEVGYIENKYVWFDKIHFNRVLVNIVTNSIKYTKEGGIVGVFYEQVGKAHDGKATFRFVVEDTGIGMSKDFLSHMFEQFSRERNTTLSQQQGTGLGLAIVKRIVDAVGGKIEVESEVGKGTKFIITADFRIQTQEELKETIDSINKENQKLKEDIELKGKHVLLVEDNELNREIGQTILSEEGLIVESAEDGQIAVEIIKEKGTNYYDFILMDIQMPIMNGYEATRRIRAMEKDGEHTTIIALSANAFEDDIKHSLASGMDAHLAKPIKFDQLKKLIKKNSELTE